jgi:hypothetical protein
MVHHEVSEALCRLCGSERGTEFPWVIPVVCHQRAIGAGGTMGVGGPVQSMTGVTLMLLPLGGMGVELCHGVWCLALLVLWSQWGRAHDDHVLANPGWPVIEPAVHRTRCLSRGPWAP